MTLIPLARSGAAELTRRAQQVLLLAAPDGLQGRARRNARRALFDSELRARDRAEAAAVMGLQLAPVRPGSLRAAG